MLRIALGGRVGVRTLVLSKIKKNGNSLLAFCPYRGLAGESPPRTTALSKMCHFASLEVRLMRIKNLSACRQLLPTASKFPHNVWSGYFYKFNPIIGTTPYEVQLARFSSSCPTNQGFIIATFSLLYPGERSHQKP